MSHEFTILSKWFYNSLIVLNPDKWSFKLLVVDDPLQINLVCGDEILKNTKQGKVLGEPLGNKLNFAIHLLNIIKNANKKFNALTRVQNYITTDRKSSYFPRLINRNLPIFRRYGCFVQTLRRVK